jgi:hypothetical protein
MVVRDLALDLHFHRLAGAQTHQRPARKARVFLGQAMIDFRMQFLRHAQSSLVEPVQRQSPADAAGGLLPVF